MSTATKNKTQQSKELEIAIQQALQKIGGSKENEVCKYLPVSGGGYMHHFTLRKMKHENPKELADMIQKFVMKATKPSKVPPKPRAAKGSRKRRDIPTFNKEILDRMRDLARSSGDDELFALLSPPKSMAACRRELIASIKRGEADETRWQDWSQAVRRYAHRPSKEEHGMKNNSNF